MTKQNKKRYLGFFYIFLLRGFQNLCCSLCNSEEDLAANPWKIQLRFFLCRCRPERLSDPGHPFCWGELTNHTHPSPTQSPTDGPGDAQTHHCPGDLQLMHFGWRNPWKGVWIPTSIASPHPLRCIPINTRGSGRREIPRSDFSHLPQHFWVWPRLLSWLPRLEQLQVVD